jgi:hypothetical protein
MAVARTPSIVIPAHAGIHLDPASAGARKSNMDSGVRRNDGREAA